MGKFLQNQDFSKYAVGVEIGSGDGTGTGSYSDAGGTGAGRTCCTSYILPGINLGGT